MKKDDYWLLYSFSIILLRWNNAPIQAAERHSQNIIIVKYGLKSASHGFSTDQSFNTGLKLTISLLIMKVRNFNP